MFLTGQLDLEYGVDQRESIMMNRQQKEEVRPSNKPANNKRKRAQKVARTYIEERRGLDWHDKFDTDNDGIVFDRNQSSFNSNSMMIDDRNYK